VVLGCGYLHGPSLVAYDSLLIPLKKVFLKEVKLVVEMEIQKKKIVLL
jgi:hypothetical protein